MSLLQPPLRAIYRGVRRASVIDVKRLMHLPAQAAVAAPAPQDYSVSTVNAETLDDLLASGLTPPSIGSACQLADGRQSLVAAFHNRQIVSYVWLARDWVPAEENFSRSPHLGTSLQLPDGSVFAHTAFTSPEHRGRRLLGAMLAWAVDSRVAGAQRMFATMDWTNEASKRAFVHLGFQQVGLIFRMGRGPVQASLYPAAAHSLGLLVAAQGGGIRLAIG